MNNINENLKNIELFINNNISNNEDKIICNYLLNNLQNKINYYIIENNNELIQNNINTEIKKQNFVEEKISEIFERLQEGKPLADGDKIWNRKEKSIPSLLLSPNGETFFSCFQFDIDWSCLVFLLSMR